ncbi:DUF4399 domain-containing protein [[Limnothrix rosea] IAM M-220]|uniref:DUF4399 domain-containing protein n=1 Tax=[Limnothrix rosea] IAM M-220 TaxID=454133 RepID=UPI001F2E40A3|nr:DUF4399 domain-containing protein [[Limnothrix rosea] IAM M-220]
MNYFVALLCSMLLTVVTFVSNGAPAMAEAIASPAPDNAQVYIISPENGSTVSSPFTIQFGLSGMGVAPAGIDRPATGHHHLLVDLETLPELDQALSATEQIKHFGGGQTEATLELPPGKHTLQLVLGNYAHVPHTPPVLSEPINITVK